MNADPNPGMERRVDLRRPVDWPARLWVDTEVLVGVAVDVSPHGLLLATAPTSSLKVGNSYRVEVLAGQRREITFNGEVRHLSDHGIGIQTSHVLLPDAIVVPRPP